MPGIKLTREEQQVADELKAAMDRLWANIKSGPRLPQAEIHRLHDELGRLGHALHTSLAKRGLEPRHHRYMLENREVESTKPEFYEHMHSVEDLLKFVDDVNANDDPLDVTMGAEFTFRAYSQRWGHDDPYRIVRTPEGWNVSFISIGGDCTREGKPFLFRNFQQDGISYPASLGGHLSAVWQAAADGADWDEVQRRIDELAEWVRVTEAATPGSRRDAVVGAPAVSAASSGDYRSAFICYGQPDAEFARDLERRLTSNGVNTRFFDRHATPGEALHRFMWQSVKQQERVIVVCSSEGLARPGLRNEIEQGFTKEASLGGLPLLIPVALDDSLFNAAGDELRERLTSRVVCRCFDRSADAAARELLGALKRAPSGNPSRG